jgi:hypothetical protein
MAASKPTSSLSRQAHILRCTQRPLRDLSCGSGFFPSRLRTLSPADCLPGFIGRLLKGSSIRSLVGVGRVFDPPRPSSRSTPCRYNSQGPTSIDFGENQLSPGLIGLSPLPAGHPSGFQPTPVRASTGCYPSFTLPTGRSPWLRVYAHQLLICALVAGLAFAVAPLSNSLASLVSSNSPDHNAKGTRSDHTESRSPQGSSHRL